MRAMFMNKPSNRGTFLPWHQDRWADFDRDPLVTIWTALDPATIENGCVRVIPGSHHALINPDHTAGFLTEEMAADLSEDQTVYLELEAGEVILLHNWLLHSSDINRSSQSRRAFSCCYMDAATVDEGGNVYPVIFGEGAMNVASLGSG
jgi:ectoine hydroxylase-related dioxygenase (phytanoyl-CoA dioxygenase family)